MSSVVRAPIGSALRGEVVVPGDKSISHRAVLFSALATGASRVRGLLGAADVRASARLVRALGVTITSDADAIVLTPPAGGLREPESVIDCGNSGTTMRLGLGIFASLPGHAVLTGDASLRRRPMRRVCEPLRRMGASLDGRDGGERAPISVRGGELSMTHHDLTIASAQVKSAVLLAGLRSGCAVREPRRSRDHSERLLTAMGVQQRRDQEGWLVQLPCDALRPLDLRVPGDISSAAFFLVAASLVPGSEVTLRGVGLNPTRTGVIDALVAMGASITSGPTESRGEPLGDLTVRAASLHGTRIDGELALRCLDELPVLAIAAACAQGTTHIRDAAELRVKESDRIARVATGLRALGVMVEEHADGLSIEGGRLAGPATIDCTGDHRLAMAFGVASLVAEGDVTLVGAEHDTSYPAFFQALSRLAGGI